MTYELVVRLICLGTIIITGLFISLLFDGVGRKIKARIQYRAGPSVFQTFYDMFKLLKTQPLISGGLGFIIAPIIAFSAAIASLSVLPVGLSTPISFSYDIFVYLYVIAMVSISFMLAGFSLQNAYANIGANREMMLILSVEPIIGIVFGSLIIITGSVSIEGIVSNAIHLGANSLLLYGLTLCIFLYCAYIESGFIPFDLAEAETEILEGPLVEYSGWLLGLFKWALLVKRFSLIWFLSALITAPWLMRYEVSPITLLFAFVVQLFIAFLLYCCMTIYEALTPRYKIDWVIRMNLKIFMVSIIYLLLVWLVLMH